MGMDYTYACSASYDRFDEELTKVADVFCGKRIKTEEGEPLKFTFPKNTNETLVNWFNNSFGEGFTYRDTFCITCKWNISFGPASMCKDCSICTNATEDKLWSKCNCLQHKPESEEYCPYYISSQNT